MSPNKMGVFHVTTKSIGLKIKTGTVRKEILLSWFNFYCPGLSDLLLDFSLVLQEIVVEVQTFFSKRKSE